MLRLHGRQAAAKAYVRLRQVLGQAVDDERISRNPCRIDGGGIEHRPEQWTVTIAEPHPARGARAGHDGSRQVAPTSPRTARKAL